MFRFLVSGILLLFVNALNAQTLIRKASLGAQLEPVEGGMKVVKTIEGTAVNIKLLEGDIIKAINEVPTPDNATIMAAIATKREGDKAEVLVVRNGQNLVLKGQYVGRPFETSSITDVIYDQVAYKNGQLRVIINKPKQEGKLPAILFIPGYTCTSIDNLRAIHPYKRIVDAFSEAGFVTLRVEKSGLGDSFNTPTCESCDLKDEIENFEVGLKKLQSLPYVDSNRIIIVGHSMGGVIAPALSAKNQVAGVIVFGTTAKSWFEYQIEMYRVQNLLAGMDPLEYEKSITDQYDLNYRFFIKKEKLTDLAKDPKNEAILKQQWMYDGNGKIYSRNAE